LPPIPYPGGNRLEGHLRREFFRISHKPKAHSVRRLGGPDEMEDDFPDDESSEREDANASISCLVCGSVNMAFPKHRKWLPQHTAAGDERFDAGTGERGVAPAQDPCDAAVVRSGVTRRIGIGPTVSRAQFGSWRRTYCSKFSGV
jgi:hypothetical protein